jgi:putative transcriptional regulator
MHPGGHRHQGRDDSAKRGVEGIVKNRLKVLRAERNWSQAELGGRLGVSRQAVNAIETGKYDPSLPLAFKLSRLFNLPIEEIFHDDVEGGSHV